MTADPDPEVLDALRRELRALAEEDARVRDALAADGSLFEGYHPRMEAIHRRHAARLSVILDQHGWPGQGMMGEQAGEAAWLIAQHAIGEPAFQRRCLRLLQDAAGRGEVPRWQPAMLEDRVRVLEGRSQVYGTQLEPDEEGRPRPCVIEDPDRVDERRRAAGLEPLAERLARSERIRLPADRARFEREREAWLRRVGWRS